MGPKYFVTGALGLIETANKRSLRRNQMRPDGMGEAFHRTRVFFSFFFLFFFNLPGSFFYLFPFSCRYRVSEGSFPYFVFFVFVFFFGSFLAGRFASFRPRRFPLFCFFFHRTLI